MWIRFKVWIVFIPILCIACIEKAAADWQLFCVTSTSYSWVLDPYYDTWIAVPSTVVVCGYIWVEPSSRESNLTQETEDQRNDRVLEEMDTCLVARVGRLLRECEGSNNPGEEDESCEVESDVLELIDDNRTYLTKDYPIRNADLSDEPLQPGQSAVGHNHNNGEDIRVDVAYIWSTYQDDAARNKRLGDAVIHERLHSSEKWCVESVPECVAPEGIEEQKVRAATARIVPELIQAAGPFSTCADWKLQ